MAFGQSLAEAGVRTQVERRLALLVADSQVRSVSGQEAGDGRSALLLCPLGAQTHDQLEETYAHTSDMAVTIRTVYMTINCQSNSCD